MTSSPVRVLVLSGVWPHTVGATEAANFVTHEMCAGLAADPRLEVAFALVNTVPVEWPAEAVHERAALEAAGVRFLDPVLVPPPSGRSTLARRARMVLGADAADLVPGAGRHDLLAPAIEAHRPDVVLTIWSELATAAAAGLPVRKVAYYGNVAPMLTDAALAMQSEIGPQPAAPARAARQLRRRLAVRAMTRAHLQVMSRYDHIADVAAHDAEWYRRHGLPSEYLSNMWPGVLDPAWPARRDETEQLTPLKIVGSVGNLSATGNTFGLHALATQVVPALRRRLGEGAFEVHVYGGRQPYPPLAPLLQDPHIKVRGFVPDLDAEILSAPIFLVANNHSSFKVGHTRFLHAWSLGGCAVAFEESRQAMPELRHEVNALLGRRPDEIADLVATAAGDHDLRRRLGRGGEETLLEAFAPATVTARMADRLVEVVRGR